MKSLSIISFAGIAFAAPQLWTPGQPVKTTSGNVKGQPATRPGYQEVSQYVGIPFAQPPLGDLRWKAPLAYKGDAEIDGTKWKDDCSQPVGSAATIQGSKEMKAYGLGMGGGNHTYGEDCLGVNVWTKPQTGEKAKAVLIWIHGGAFSSGTPHAPFMDGARFAGEQDVVLVSMSYRINIMGFPNAPGLDKINLGLLDQRLAVEWVRDNIQNFGGDPKRITIFGESAGGAAVDMYAYAWPKDPIINGIIAQSGTAGLRSSGGSSKAAPYKAWYDVSKRFNCGGSEKGDATVECMKKIPAADIQKTLDSMSTGLGGTPFGPGADSVLPADLGKAAATGSYIKVPLLVGNTDHESGLTAAIAPKGGKSSTSAGGGAMGNMMDTAMTCGSAKAAEMRMKAGIPAWRYRYMGVFDNSQLGPGTGAYHSSDVAMVFGATEMNTNNIKDSPEEAKLATDTMKAWATFAKDPQKGLISLGWPMYDANKDTLVRIGYNNASALNLGKATQYDSGCALLNKMTG